MALETLNLVSRWWNYPQFLPPSATLHHITNDERGNVMGACTCGYTTDPEKNCNGTHKVVQAVKADIAEALEANGFPHASEYVKTNKITPKSE